jgi:Xaa-Pro aminopeptidase
LFYYLCGLETHHTYCLISGRERRSTLFIPEGSATGESPEDALGIENEEMLRKTWLLDEVKPVSAMRNQLATVTTLYVPHTALEGLGATSFQGNGCERKRFEHEWDRSEPRAQRLMRLLHEAVPGIVFKDLCPILNDMRLIKSPAEIEVLRQAGELSALALAEAMKATRPGSTETQLQALAEYIFRHYGHSDPAYEVIAASGTDTWQGHYSRNNKVLQDGDVVLMDCAPNLRHYTSDICRVWPVSGTYLPWQRKVYGMITEYEKVLLGLIRPGRTPQAIYAEAAKIMKQKVRSADFPYRGTARLVDQMIKKGVNYFNHAVGLSVHDRVSPWRESPLKAGMVFVVDPMVWVHNKQHYIRVEDTVVVTRNGYECLTGDVPAEPAAIEALMREDSNFRI